MLIVIITCLHLLGAQREVVPLPLISFYFWFANSHHSGCEVVFHCLNKVLQEGLSQPGGCLVEICQNPASLGRGEH